MNNFMVNSFQVPNLLIDKYILHLKDIELKVFLIIIRKTKGWNKEYDAISISLFKKILNLKDDRTIRKAIASLKKLDLIKKEEKRGKITKYAINLTPNPLHVDERGHEDVPPTSSCNNPLHEDVGGPLASGCTPTKDIITKDIITKDNNHKKSKTLETKEKQSSCSSDNKNLEKWILEKSKKARNPSAYAASIKRKVLEKEQSILDEFRLWESREEEFKQKETQQEEEYKILNADYNIFINNPQILEKYIKTDKPIKQVVDNKLSTLDIFLEGGQTLNLFKKDLYPILKTLEQKK